MRKLMSALPADAAAKIAADPLYRRLGKHRRVDLVTIAMQPDGISSGAGDFSPMTIHSRIAQGEDAADKALIQRQKLSQIDLMQPRWSEAGKARETRVI